jgi:hypothetical protein
VGGKTLDDGGGSQYCLLIGTQVALVQPLLQVVGLLE